MDKDRVEGAAHQVKGAVKEAVGKVTGDAKTEAEGAAEKAAGKVHFSSGEQKSRHSPDIFGADGCLPRSAETCGFASPGLVTSKRSSVLGVQTSSRTAPLSSVANRSRRRVL